MRKLTALEVVLAIAVGGSILAATIPVFVRNVHASRLAEPLQGLEQLTARATALAMQRETSRAYPESVGLTPEHVPAGVRVTDPPGTWEHSTWRRLDFRFTTPHAFSFSFQSQNAPERSWFVARAHGDLDGDGVFSTFERGGQVEAGKVPEIGHLEVRREVE